VPRCGEDEDQNEQNAAGKNDVAHSKSLPFLS
jgi:hypothetical protein